MESRDRARSLLDGELSDWLRGAGHSRIERAHALFQHQLSVDSARCLIASCEWSDIQPVAKLYDRLLLMGKAPQLNTTYSKRDARRLERNKGILCFFDLVYLPVPPPLPWFSDSESGAELLGVGDSASGGVVRCYWGFS